MKIDLLSKKAERIILAVILFVFILLALLKINSPGLHYDEVLFVNAASGLKDPFSFSTLRLGSIPVLLMPYIGALKSWLFMPIFKLFGISVYSIRIPMTLLYGTSLFILYCVLQNVQRNKLVNLGIIFLLAIDVSTLLHVRYDFGPVVVEFLCKVLAIYLLAIFIKKPNARILMAIGLVLLAGVFNKLNFIWFVNAFSLSVLAVYGSGIWHKLEDKSKKRQITLVASVGYLLCAAYYLLISVVYKIGNQFSFQAVMDNLGLLPRRFSGIISGSWYYTDVIGSSNQIVSRVYALFFVALILLALAILMMAKKDKVLNIQERKFFIFNLFLICLLIAQMLVSAQAVASWHFLMLQPFLIIVFVLSLLVLYRRILIARVFRRQYKTLLNGFLVLIILFSVYAQLNIYFNFIRNIDKPIQNKAWSLEINNLVDFTKSTDREYIVMDWGIHTQLLALDPSRGKYHEDYFMFSDPKTDAELVEAAKKYNLGKARFILHSPKNTYNPMARANFFRLSKILGLKPEKIKEFVETGGSVIFEVYELRP